jgi:ATP-dependent protease ClpP protease subunit
MGSSQRREISIVESQRALHVPAVLLKPQVRLNGSVEDKMLEHFLQRMEALAEATGPVVVELTTTGGDAEIGRRIATEIRLCRDQMHRDMLFLGKTCVYSAGITIMSAFPKKCRYLTRDTVLLIHGRRLEKTLELSGPLTASKQIAEELLAQLEIGLQLESEGFSDLVRDTEISDAEVTDRARTNWYLSAAEALHRRLVEAIF